MVTTKAVQEAFKLMQSECKMPKDMQAKVLPADDPEKIARWAVMLGDFDDDTVAKTALKCTMTRQWFPSISEFRETAGGSIEDRAMLAWQTVREAMRQLGSYASIWPSDLGGDGVAMWCVDKMGWQELNTMKSDDVPHRQRDFIKLYKAAAEAGHVHTGHIAGIHECQNRFNGHDSLDLASLGRHTINVPPELEAQYGPRQPLKALVVTEQPQLPMSTDTVPKELPGAIDALEQRLRRPPGERRQSAQQ